MIEQKQKNYTIQTPMGHKIQVIRLSQEDIERELGELEAKYEMTSQEFVGKWNRGELDCGVMDYFTWAGYCDSAYRNGRDELEIVYESVEELKIEG